MMGQVSKGERTKPLSCHLDDRDLLIKDETELHVSGAEPVRLKK